MQIKGSQLKNKNWLILNENIPNVISNAQKPLESKITLIRESLNKQNLENDNLNQKMIQLEGFKDDLLEDKSDLTKQLKEIVQKNLNLTTEIAKTKKENTKNLEVLESAYTNNLKESDQKYLQSKNETQEYKSYQSKLKKELDTIKSLLNIEQYDNKAITTKLSSLEIKLKDIRLKKNQELAAQELHFSGKIEELNKALKQKETLQIATKDNNILLERDIKGLNARVQGYLDKNILYQRQIEKIENDNSEIITGKTKEFDDFKAASENKLNEVLEAKSEQQRSLNELIVKKESIERKNRVLNEKIDETNKHNVQLANKIDVLVKDISNQQGKFDKQRESVELVYQGKLK